jgi:thioredoxin reductase (NADPH)
MMKGTMNDSSNSVEVAIVGAGPIGVELAVALKRQGIPYLHFDAQQVGHTISWFAPGTRFFSSTERICIAGVPLQTVDQGKASREEYLAYLRGVVEQFDLDVRTFEPVEDIHRLKEGFELVTRPAGGPRTYRARNVVLTTGGTARARKLNIPGEELGHVSHYLGDLHQYFRRRVLIVGGRNSAVEAALRIHRLGGKVSMSYRQAAFDESSIKYWLMPEMNALAKSGRIPVYFRTEPTGIEADRVNLRHLDSGQVTQVAADVVLALIGYEADMSLCRKAGVELRRPGDVPVFDEKTMETNVPGVFVAGTAIGGTQARYRVFIENCHVHVERIMACLTGQTAARTEVVFAQPES